MSEYSHITEEGKRYNLSEKDNGDQLRHYESGTVYNWTKKHIEKGYLTTEIAILTQSNSVIARKEKARAKIRDWVLSEVQAITPDDVNSFEDAYGAIVGRLANESYGGDATLQSRVRAAEFIGKATGLEDRVIAEVTDEQGNKIVGDIASVLDMIRGGGSTPE